MACCEHSINDGIFLLELSPPSVKLLVHFDLILIKKLDFSFRITNFFFKLFNNSFLFIYLLFMSYPRFLHYYRLLFDLNTELFMFPVKFLMFEVQLPSFSQNQSLHMVQMLLETSHLILILFLSNILRFKILFQNCRDLRFFVNLSDQLFSDTA